ncbi:TPA: hypothetical protein IAA87_08605 [Candidatus Avigastranaerophilus faecigallinarum]|nr:hypothetical protein [Candidatus Avigastranaerophilus faecigallinarum]
MKVTITSKNNEKVFNDSNVINIGTAPNCHFKLNLDFDLIISLQKLENGKWQIVNNFKSNKVLFRGQPIGPSIEIGSLCKLMIADTDEYISIKITAAGTNPKVVPGSLELANRKNAERIKRAENKRTITMIGDEELNEQDIETLYGKGVGAQTKIKIDRKKADIERRRALITKEIAYKANYLRNKLVQNELILAFLNFFIVFVPFSMAMILKDIIRYESQAGQNMQNRLLFLAAIGFIVITLVLKLGQFLTLQNKGKVKVTQSSKTIQSLCLLSGGGIFASCILFSMVELTLHTYSLPLLIPQMLIGCSFLCIFLGIFAAIIQNTIAETGEELDSYESREDFQAVVKDYQQWIALYVNNISRKKLKDISNKIFNLEIKAGIEYVIGILTAPFLAYGVSQTLAECFPEAAGWIRLAEGFKFSPIFLTLAVFMIVFAFHCFATSFATTKRVLASNVIKQDGFSDYNVHGVVLHGVESSKNLKKEAKKFFLIALAVVFIEITMNVSYFIGVMGGDVMGMVLSFVAALLPTAILIMETTMLGNTKFEIIIREELLEKVDKDF